MLSETITSAANTLNVTNHPDYALCEAFMKDLVLIAEEINHLKSTIAIRSLAQKLPIDLGLDGNQIKSIHLNIDRIADRISDFKCQLTRYNGLLPQEWLFTYFMLNTVVAKPMLLQIADKYAVVFNQQFNNPSSLQSIL